MARAKLEPIQPLYRTETFRNKENKQKADDFIAQKQIGALIKQGVIPKSKLDDWKSKKKGRKTFELFMEAVEMGCNKEDIMDDLNEILDL